jgi:hypothetical protein
VQILRIGSLAGSWRYVDTHSITELLLDAVPEDIGGFSWPSNPAGDGRAFVFYAPPLSSRDFEPLESFELDSLRGRDLIDQALARGRLSPVQL